MLKFFIKIYNKFFKKKNETLIEEDLLQSIKREIYEAMFRHESCISLCGELPNNIIEFLLKNGYNVSVYYSENNDDCHCYTLNKKLKRTKIYW